MSKRKTYRPGEVKAGHTLFIVVAHFDRQQRRQYGVIEHLVASKRVAEYLEAEYLVDSEFELPPEYVVQHPYRMHPLMANYAADMTDLWKTRKAARAEAERRQAMEDAA